MSSATSRVTLVPGVYPSGTFDDVVQLVFEHCRIQGKAHKVGKRDKQRYFASRCPRPNPQRMFEHKRQKVRQVIDAYIVSPMNDDEGEGVGTKAGDDMTV